MNFFKEITVLSKINGPAEKDPNGGDYRRQAVFYKILIDNYNQKDRKVVSTEFDFIEPEKIKHTAKKKSSSARPIRKQETTIYQLMEKNSNP